MKRIPTQKRAQAKYEGLLEAALLEFADHGYELTTSKSIAARAGVASGSFYQYFDDKDDILQTLTHSRYEVLKEKFHQLDSAGVVDINNIESIRQRIFSILDLLVTFHAELAEFHTVIHQRRLVDQSLNTFITSVEQDFKSRVELFVSHFTDHSPQMHAFIISSMAEGLVHSVVYQQPDFDKDEILDQTVTLIIGYLITLHAEKRP